MKWKYLSKCNLQLLHLNSLTETCCVRKDSANMLVKAAYLQTQQMMQSHISSNLRAVIKNVLVKHA